MNDERGARARLAASATRGALRRRWSREKESCDEIVLESVPPISKKIERRSLGQGTTSPNFSIFPAHAVRARFDASQSGWLQLFAMPALMVLLIMTVIVRCAASLEARPRRIENFIGRLDGGA